MKASSGLKLILYLNILIPLRKRLNTQLFFEAMPPLDTVTYIKRILQSITVCLHIISDNIHTHLNNRPGSTQPMNLSCQPVLYLISLWPIFFDLLKERRIIFFILFNEKEKKHCDFNFAVRTISPCIGLSQVFTGKSFQSTVRSYLHKK